MPEIVSRSLNWLVSWSDPSTRNLASLVLCMALYGVFLCRDRGAPTRGSRRPYRNADSVLRGG